MLHSMNANLEYDKKITGWPLLFIGRESPVNILGVIYSTFAFNRQGSQVEDLPRDLKR